MKLQFLALGALDILINWFYYIIVWIIAARNRPISTPIAMNLNISIRDLNIDCASCLFDLNSNLPRVIDLIGFGMLGGLHPHGSLAKNISGSHRCAGITPCRQAFQYCSHVPAPMYNMFIT